MSQEKSDKQGYTFLVLFEKDADGYVVSCPALHIYTQGNTYEEACMMLADALKLNEDIVFKANDTKDWLISEIVEKLQKLEDWRVQSMFDYARFMLADQHEDTPGV